MNGELSFAGWLDERLKEIGMTRRELAAAMEVSEAALYSWLADPDAKHARTISARNADIMARVLGVNPNEVREAAGLPMRRSGPSFMPAKRQEELAAARVIFVPVIGIAPSDNLRHMALVGEMIPVSSNIIQRIVSPKAIIVSGNSLNRYRVYDGDQLILETDDQAMNPEEGNVVIVAIDGEMTPREWLVINDNVILRPVEAVGQTLSYPNEDVTLVGVARSVLSAKHLS